MGKVINVQMDEDFYNEIIQGGGSGNGSGESNAIYYKFSEPLLLDYDAEMFLKEENVFSGARGYYDKSYGYYYSTASAIKAIVGATFTSNGYIDAVEFKPIQFLKSWQDMSVITYNDFESLAESFPDIFGKLGLSRITAEEYWEHLKA